MNSFKENISQLILRRDELWRVLDIKNKQSQIQILEDETQTEKFWDNSIEAKKF